MVTNDPEYIKVARDLTRMAGIQATLNRRNNAEQAYVAVSKRLGLTQKLRGKYRGQ